MTAKTWGLAALLATVLANTGCVTCCHKSYQKALQNGAECDLPAPCRNQVYVFLIHGVTPSTECGLSTLRVKLAESGFAKVGVGELASALEIACEVKKIRRASRRRGSCSSATTWAGPRPSASPAT